VYLPSYALQVHVSTNQLINTARVLADPSQQHLLQVLAPMQQQQQQQQHTTGATAQHAAAGTTAAHQAAPEHAASAAGDAAVQQLPASQAIVVGDEYYAAKEQLFVAEQVVLRLMRFELGVEQPHKHLFNFCRLLGLQQEQSAAAVCVLNDGIAYTTLVCKYQAAVVAAAALQYVLSSSQPQRTAGRAAAGQHAAGSTQASTAQSDAQHSSRHGGRTGRHGSPGSSRDHPARDSHAYSHWVLNDSSEWIQWVGLQETEVSAAQQELCSLFQSGNVD